MRTALRGGKQGPWGGVGLRDVLSTCTDPKTDSLSCSLAKQVEDFAPGGRGSVLTLYIYGFPLAVSSQGLPTELFLTLTGLFGFQKDREMLHVTLWLTRMNL